MKLTENTKVWINQYCSINLEQLNITRTSLIKDMIKLRNEITIFNRVENMRAITAIDKRKIEIDGSISTLKALQFCSI